MSRLLLLLLVGSLVTVLCAMGIIFLLKREGARHFPACRFVQNSQNIWFWACVVQTYQPNMEDWLAPELDHQFIKLRLDDQELTVEVVNTVAGIVQGLSGRSEIGSQGMLFILGQPRIASFWMKEMQFDLDMVWLRDHQVIGVTADVPAPNPQTPLEHLPLYTSPQMVDMVLELPAGRASELKIQVGSELRVLESK